MISRNSRYPSIVTGLVAVIVVACGVQENSSVATDTSYRSIALSFDDVSKGDGPFLSGAERTTRLITTLRDVGVVEAMFFVTTGNVESQGEAGRARVRQYAAAGHVLGNHSHSHNWLSRTNTDDYIADIDRAQLLLAAYDNVLPYFRFPYLDEGRGVDKRDAVRAALAERGLRNAYVTVDTYDWYLDRLAKEALERGAEFDESDLRDLYVNVIAQSVEFYDAMAQRTLGRSPQHMLLLHENDLAALFVGDLVVELRARGWRIVPASLAFNDAIADREPDTLALGQGRVAALAHERGESAASLISPTEDEEYLDRRFEKEVLPDSL